MISFAVARHAKASAKAVSRFQDNHIVFTLTRALAHIRDRNRLKGWHLEQRPTPNAQRPTPISKKRKSSNANAGAVARGRRRPRAQELKRNASITSYLLPFIFSIRSLSQ